MVEKSITPKDISAQFWQLLADGRKDIGQFEQTMNSLSKEDLYRFYWTYRYAMGVLKMPPYADYLDPELSGDSTEDVCMWIVAQGRDYYLAIIDDPQKMPFDVADPNPDCIYLNAAAKAFLKRFNTFPDYPDNQDFMFG